MAAAEGAVVGIEEGAEEDDKTAEDQDAKTEDDKEATTQKMPKLEPDAPVHKLQLAEGKMPMMVYTPTIKDATASFVPIGLGRQKNSDKWRCRFCSLLVDQPGLPEEDMFNRLCALNDPDSRECKVVPPA